jgi:(4S)-4-hydroxy-5-phosphonooxypentane-2,3-dione isomerase
MQVTVVNISVKPGHIHEFIAATKENHEASLKEPGNMRFDFLQSEIDPFHFFLYEAYISEEASHMHKKTPHYLKWKALVDPWMSEPRKGTPCTVISPDDLELW